MRIELLPWRWPDGMVDVVPFATGPDSDRCFRLGDRPYRPGPLTSALCLRPDEYPRRDGRRHGQIEPECVMALEAYQAAVWATREEWIIDEGGP